MSQTLPPDHRIGADARVAAEDRRVGVDRHVVPDVGMALHALDGVALVVRLERLGAQGHALVELHVGADGRGLADDDARCRGR